MLAVFAIQGQAAWWQMIRTGTSFRSIMPADLAVGRPPCVRARRAAGRDPERAAVRRPRLLQPQDHAGLRAGGRVAGAQGPGPVLHDALRAVGRAGARRGLRSAAVALLDQRPVGARHLPGRGPLGVGSARRPAGRAEAVDDPAGAVAGRPALPAPHARLRHQQPGHRERRLADHLLSRDDRRAVARRALRRSRSATAAGVVLSRSRRADGAGRSRPGWTRRSDFGAPKGYSQFVAQADWASSVGTPRVLSVALSSGGKRTVIARP